MAGLVRLAVTKATGYHVDMAEYGKHWNFFLTLAVVGASRVCTQALQLRGCLAAGDIPGCSSLSCFCSHKCLGERLRTVSHQQPLMQAATDISIGCALVCCCSNAKLTRCVVAGSIVMAAHQAFLSMGGIGLAHAAERGPDFLHANKEGLISLAGFCSLSLLSRGFTLYMRSHLHAASCKAADMR